ncbi:Hypothetical predicted protein [Cloeon dipterum]|uniref:Uncharacterized protein n=1 Tax=Cloeon dipterum TaxID=197152 RepID=A0A8S1C4K8_9INSE|nr:Hypothetical predicted protein [Cloeon dipterum]
MMSGRVVFVTSAKFFTCCAANRNTAKMVKPKPAVKSENLMSIKVEEIIKELIQLQKAGATTEILALCERYSPLFTAQRFNFAKMPPNGYRLFLHARGIKLAALPKEKREKAEIPIWNKMDKRTQEYFNNRAIKLSFLQRVIHETNAGTMTVLKNLKESEIQMWTTHDPKAAEKFDKMEFRAFDRRSPCNPIPKQRRLIVTSDGVDCDESEDFSPSLKLKIKLPKRPRGRPKQVAVKGIADCLKLRNRKLQRPKRTIKKKNFDAYVEINESEDEDFMTDVQPLDSHSDVESPLPEEEPCTALSQHVAMEDSDTPACTTLAVTGKELVHYAGSSKSNSPGNSEVERFVPEKGCSKGAFTMFEPPYSTNSWFFVQVKNKNIWSALKEKRKAVANVELFPLSAEETPPAIESRYDAALLPVEESDVVMLEEEAIAERAVVLAFEQDRNPLTNDANLFAGASSLEFSTQPQAHNRCEVEQIIQNVTFSLETGETTSIDSTVRHISYDLNCFETVPNSDETDYPTNEVVLFSGIDKEGAEPSGNAVEEPFDLIDLADQDANNCYSILSQQFGSLNPLIDEMIFNSNTDFVKDLAYPNSTVDA